MRRVSKSNTKTKNALIEAAQNLLYSEGYAAVTSRRVAAEAGVKSQIVHYYFESMDDLFIAVFRKLSDVALTQMSGLLASESPLQDLWEMLENPDAVIISNEFAALANHRKRLQAELLEFREHYRALQTRIVARELERLKIDQNEWPAEAVSLAMVILARGLAEDTAMGEASKGYASLHKIIMQSLKNVG